MIISILLFILILSFLVIIHELGHYFAAKWQGIHVEEFGVGYPPLARKLFHWRGTDFTLNWIPFGGFVKMEGENGPQDAPAERSAAAEGAPFYQKPALARLIVILAGAIVNIVFGMMAFALVFSVIGIPGGAVVAEIAERTPALKAGVPIGVVITDVEIGDQTIPILTGSELRPLFVSNLGRQVTLVTKAQCDRQLCEEVTRYTFSLPSADEVNVEDNEQALSGIRPREFMVFYPWYEQIARGVLFGCGQALQLSVAVVSALGTMFKDLATRGQVPQELAGPIGIAQQATQSGILLSGWDNVVLFTGLISINLGIMNVLPIPALDGGRAVFIMLEKIIGRTKVNIVEGHANEVGFIVLIALMILISARDIFRIITGA